MSVTSGGTASNPCRSGGRFSAFSGRGSMVMVFFRLEGAVVLLPPGEDRALQVGGIDDDPAEAVILGRVVRGADLQRHLVVFAQVDGLYVLALAQVPEMDRMAVLVGQKVLGHQPVLELRRQAPFRADHVVARQVPPEIVMLVLLAAVHLVAPEDVEGLAIHDEDAGRPVGAVLAAAAQRRDIDALRAAMNGVRARIARLGKDLLGLDDLVDARLQGFLHVDHVDARRPDARNDQVAPFQKRVPGQRRKRRGTGVPSEMVKTRRPCWA